MADVVVRSLKRRRIPSRGALWDLNGQYGILQLFNLTVLIYFKSSYNYLMIITKLEPFTKEEIVRLREQFDSYIKTVIDVEKKICSAGCDRHFESEKILLKQGSRQSNVWGGGIDLEAKIIDCNSFINVRPVDKNTSNEIQDAEVRKRYEKLTQYFFENIL
jgi:hypothetical protein